MNSDKKDCNRFLMYNLSLVIGNTLESALFLPYCLVLLTSALYFLLQRVQCGNHYTVCSTTSNELYYWGLRNKTPLQMYLQDNDSKSSTTDSFVNNNDLRLESVTPRSGTTKAGHSRQPSLTSVTSATSNKDSMHGQCQIYSNNFKPS